MFHSVTPYMIAYLIGSIPFGLIITRAFGAGDVRTIGSGNIGATNVLRTGRKGLALATLLLDLSKGVLAVLLMRHFYTEAVAITAGLFAVLGHVFPVWLKLKGGKGVATALGVLLALNPWVGLSVLTIWLIVFYISRFSSLSSIIAMSCAPIIAHQLDSWLVALICLIFAVLIIFTHRQNVKRLLTGTEPTFKKSES